MSPKIFFVTGTDTGVGKTVVAALLTRHWVSQRRRVAALKPVSSGNRHDARLLRAAAGGGLSLDEVNPWHFRVPVAPVWAAAREGRVVRLAEVVRHVRQLARRFDWLVVEGAGGLLSPMGTDFDNRDLLLALQAVPVVVACNRLGAINLVRLVLEALPPRLAGRACVVLVMPAQPDAATAHNARWLVEWVSASRLLVCPRLRPGWERDWPAGVPAVVRDWLNCFTNSNADGPGVDA